jgi:hypothetical protein
MIHACGDSHIGFFAEGGQDRWREETGTKGIPYIGEYDPNWRTVHLPGLLAHSFKPGRWEFDWVNRNLPEGAKVLMVLGEIDCRKHILKQAAKQGRPWIDILNELMDGYLAALDILAKRYAIAVWAPHLAVKEEPDGFPLMDRLQVVFAFMRALQVRCPDHGFPVFALPQEPATVVPIENMSAFVRTLFHPDFTHLSTVPREWVVNDILKWGNS